MSRNKLHITVFEHESIRVGQTYNGHEFQQRHFDQFATYFEHGGHQYYSLGHNRVLFKEFVGVIQLGHILVEVLPKADNKPSTEENKQEWRKRLVDILRSVGLFQVFAPSSSTLKIKNNSILDLYFELFVAELEYLLHRGLAKRYRKTEGNLNALKGQLLFARHIQENLVHQERSYVRYSTYDIYHSIHFILYKALKVMKLMNHQPALQSRIGALLLHFPEMPDIRVTESHFQKLTLNRKTTHYEKALEMARLLLLNYHPDLARGQNNVLALMFDMNLLWERFVLVSLRRGYISQGMNVIIRGQHSQEFWQPDKGKTMRLRPDIHIEFPDRTCFVLDTKWKNLQGKGPSPDDLRQMFAYALYFKAEKVALVYPGKFMITSGIYAELENFPGSKSSCLIELEIHDNISEFQHHIFNSIHSWIESGDFHTSTPLESGIS